MEEQSNIVFEIEKPVKRFQKHLQPKENERIIFSGKFGIGKTYFLKKFFEANEDYNVIHLFPVNYSVADNKDIFELIKHDILYEFLFQDFKGVEFEKFEIGKFRTLLQFAGNNVFEIFKPFVTNVSKTGKAIVKVIETLAELQKQFEDYHSELETDDKAETIRYLERFREEIGSIYEEDFYTQLINQLVAQLKKDGEKEVVLIIDDLDRIDPEHIFRILNVLAAHTDNPADGENKFDFDKIILVCDIDNIRNIYHHKYGENVDFEGYIDKFYSDKTFHFSNYEGISEQINDLLKEIEVPERIKEFYESLMSDQVAYILASMVKSGQLSTRQIKSKEEKVFSYKDTYSLPPNLTSKSKSASKTLILLEFLKWFFEDLSELKKRLLNTECIIERSQHININVFFVGEAVKFLDNFDENDEKENGIYYSSYANQSFSYKVFSERNQMGKPVFDTSINNYNEGKTVSDKEFKGNTDFSKLRYTKVLVECIDFYLARRYLHQ